MLRDDELLALNHYDDNPIVCETDEDILRFARAVEKAAYEAAIKACAVTRGKNHAEAAAFKSGTKAYVQACDDCEDAIRSLMEQPK